MVDIIDFNQKKKEISNREKRELITRDIKYSEMLDKIKIALDQCIDGLITIEEFKAMIENFINLIPALPANYQDGHTYLAPNSRQKLLDKYSFDLNQLLVKTAIIKQLPNGRYRLYSRKKDKSGKRRNLGTFDSLDAAKKREKQVQFFKYHADDQNNRDKETKALSILSDTAKYLEEAGYVKAAKEMYALMDAIDGNLDSADDMIPDAQRNVENMGTLGDTGISSGLFGIQEAEKLANLANKLDKMSCYDEADNIDVLLFKSANLEEEAEAILKEDPTALFELGPEFFPDHLVKKYIKAYVIKNPFSYFGLKLDKKYPELAEMAAKQALINNDEAFLNYNLHVKYPDLIKEHMQQLAEHSPKKFFRFQYIIGDYPELEPLAARNLFRTDKDEFKKQNLDKKYPTTSLEDNADDNDVALAKKVYMLKRDYKDGKFLNVGDAQDFIYMMADRLNMNPNNPTQGGFLSGLAVAMDIIDSRDAFGNPEAYQDALKMYQDDEYLRNPEEMDNLDALVRSNGLQGNTSIDGGSAGQFAGLSDAYFYQNYENLDHRYKIAP